MIPDGVYLNLSFAAYNADPALRSSDLKDILVDAVDWHGRERNPVWRALNPPSDEETAAKRFGSALHCMALEPDEFDTRYVVEPIKPDFPRTKEQIAEALAEIGRPSPKSGAKKIEFEAAARMVGLELESDWSDRVAIICAGRERIPVKWYDALKMLHRVMELHSNAMKFLGNGRAEVSVFWTDAHGVRQKVRFDYLRIRTVSDVKSYAHRRGKTPVQAFCDARDDFAYDFSAAMYMDARINVLPGLVEAGKVYDARLGELGAADALTALPEDLEFMQKVAAFDDPSWWWIGCKTMSVPQVLTMEFPRSLLAFQSAQVQLEQARQTYRDMRAKFGDDDSEMWMSDDGLIRLTDHNFSLRSTNRGAVLHEIETA